VEQALGDRDVLVAAGGLKVDLGTLFG